MRVDRGRLDVRVAARPLNEPKIAGGSQQPGRERVPQGVEVHHAVEPGPSLPKVEQLLSGSSRETGTSNGTSTSTPSSNEERRVVVEGLRVPLLPCEEGDQLPARLLGNDDLPLDFAFGGLRSQRDHGPHAFAVANVADVQGHQLGDAEPGRDGEEEHQVIAKIALRS